MSQAAAFSVDEIRELAESLGISAENQTQELHERLNESADFVPLWLSLGASGSPSSRLEAYGRTERAAKRLLQSVGVQHRADGSFDRAKLSEHSTYTALVWHFAEQFRERHAEWAIQDGRAASRVKAAIDQVEQMLIAIQEIHAAAERGAQKAEADRSPGRGGDRRDVDTAFHYLLGDLLRIYVDITGRKVGTSLGSAEEASGPLIRFLSFVLPRFGWKLSNNAIRSRLQRLPMDYLP